MDIEKLEAHKMERSLIGAYVTDLRRYVPFAYCLFAETSQMGDIVVVGHCHKPSNLLRLTGVLGASADHLGKNLVEIATEAGVVSFDDVKRVFIDALLPGVSGFSLEGFEVVQDGSKSPDGLFEVKSVLTPLNQFIKNQIREAEQQLMIIDSIKSIRIDTQTLALQES